MSDSPPIPLEQSLWPRLGKALTFLLVPVLVAAADEVVVAPTDAGTDTAAATKPATRQRARAERRTSMGLSRVDNSSHTYNRGHNG